MQANLSSLKGHPIVRIVFAIVYLISGLFANAIQALLYVLIKPWNVRLYRKLIRYPMYIIYNQFVFLTEWWSHSEYDLFVNPENLNKFGKEHAMFVMNHGREIDASLAWVIPDHFGVLGNIKGFGKSSLRYVPIFGWGLFFAEFVFLNRNWKKDQKRIERKLIDLSNYPDPMWFSILAEGTRLTSEKMKISQQVAREKGLHVLENLLLPRTKGFIVGVKSFKGRIPAIYVSTIAVCKDSWQNATLRALLKGKKVSFKMMIKRYTLNELPEDEGELANWIHKRYHEKDRLLENVYRWGEFEPEGIKSASTEEMKELHRNFKYVKLPPTIYSLMAMVVPAVVILGLILMHVVNTVTRGDYFHFVTIIFAMMTGSVALEKIISMSTTISSYGETK